MGANPTRHVLIALALTALVFVVAGSNWNARIARFGPATIKTRGS